MNQIWRRIKRYVMTGKETPKVDFKISLALNTKPEKAEFAKDVMAIANTPGGDGYLILGIQDSKIAATGDWAESVIGFRAPLGADEFHRQMVDALNDFCSRIPQVDYDEVTVPDLDCVIGVVTIKHSLKRPHSFSKDGEGIRQNHIPIRRGTKTMPMVAPDELDEMYRGVGATKAIILLNLSGHPVTEDQQRQLIERGFFIEEVIECPAHFMNESIVPQIDALLLNVDLTIEEWNTKRIAVVPAGLSAPSIALIA
ncbi:MAG TPA: CRISPR-associated protein Csx15, partial [Caldilineaceae bacterium]|nr:CRISPR-associated protein Csx15 [Caldilineaceae bacterium]